MCRTRQVAEADQVEVVCLAAALVEAAEEVGRCTREGGEVLVN